MLSKQHLINSRNKKTSYFSPFVYFEYTNMSRKIFLPFCIHRIKIGMNENREKKKYITIVSSIAYIYKYNINVSCLVSLFDNLYCFCIDTKFRPVASLFICRLDLIFGNFVYSICFVVVSVAHCCKNRSFVCVCVHHILFYFYVFIYCGYFDVCVRNSTNISVAYILILYFLTISTVTFA